ncbi:Mediator complex, subunit Med11 [Metarhizium album ARSEF 1941]|uniref:Mediator of RNA polymerase II transcription subunit 11 n=1 Tax=Metarhizium album (strain ARSEF 1941) TaxID=1081103 RepID=A0A0B2WUR3_METAS|nr:Mediator complex, subunit Med11 [Metarhizium album ARSEF 1941]KHN97222.1 Mediator complex, subunit Med11 [Metarhizium album ARSEF 1941]
MSQDGDPQQSQISEPFTVEENIHQLNAIDKSIAQLMSQTATALNALTTQASSNTPSNGEASASVLDPPAQKEAFKSATDSFLTTLHSIDVRMKRQIMALEEAGIVRLSNTPRQDPNGATKASLKPNGVGTVGNLDVGWLNSRSTRVERDMEAELWQDAKEFLQKEQNGTV